MEHEQKLAPNVQENAGVQTVYATEIAGCSAAHGVVVMTFGELRGLGGPPPTMERRVCARVAFPASQLTGAIERLVRLRDAMASGASVPGATPN